MDTGGGGYDRRYLQACGIILSGMQISEVPYRIRSATSSTLAVRLGPV